MCVSYDTSQQISMIVRPWEPAWRIPISVNAAHIDKMDFKAYQCDFCFGEADP